MLTLIESQSMKIVVQHNFGLYNYMLEDICYRGQVELIKTDRFNNGSKTGKSPKTPFWT